ncbi:hypothetical protein SUGI_1061680 [Cryptomeria japonica]|nr:hypothetical protein SUGI_1061680 [Cryptomeria japonica]
MDVFHVIDKYGKKIMNEGVIDYIQQILGTNACFLPTLRRYIGVKDAMKHTSIELIGIDQSGLLSKVFVVLADLKCNMVGKEVWTHNVRAAFVLYVTDEIIGALIDDP